VRLEVNDWHLVVEFGWELLVNAALVSVVAGTVHEETIDKDTIFWLLFNFFWLFELHDTEGELKFIDRDLVDTSMGLEGSSQETLWEEES
jgi:hypothetical protein